MFSTFCKMIPRNFKRLDLSCRRVCVCTKDYNLEQKVETLNKAARQKPLDLSTTVRQLSTMTLCPMRALQIEDALTENVPTVAHNLFTTCTHR